MSSFSAQGLLSTRSFRYFAYGSPTGRIPEAVNGVRGVRPGLRHLVLFEQP
jgi:hypothetical protein